MSRATHESAMLAALQDIRLPEVAEGGAPADLAAAVALGAVLALGAAGLVRLLLRRRRARRAPTLSDRLDALGGQEAAVRRVGLLHLARDHLPAHYTAVKPDLYRRDTDLDLDALEATLRRHV
ncbi:hypothetical protein [Roseovarius autotrophicus]|uniref:hypothetical protein n=1 Tax=Roseovarius autotrophicus TaxID=2824121 RepID=UPI001A054E6B|nr:hypothetical protein [Roseovarius autotrophicus]MBE0452373.1 hypothetical protein [Roseovarius sp.]